MELLKARPGRWWSNLKWSAWRWAILEKVGVTFRCAAHTLVTQSGFFSIIAGVSYALFSRAFSQGPYQMVGARAEVAAEQLPFLLAHLAPAPQRKRTPSLPPEAQSADRQERSAVPAGQAAAAAWSAPSGLQCSPLPGRRPEAGGRKPEAGSPRPEAGGRKPEAGSRRPEAGGRKSEPCNKVSDSGDSSGGGRPAQAPSLASSRARRALPWRAAALCGRRAPVVVGVGRHAVGALPLVLGRVLRQPRAALVVRARAEVTAQQLAHLAALRAGVVVAVRPQLRAMQWTRIVIHFCPELLNVRDVQCRSSGDG